MDTIPVVEHPPQSQPFPLSPRAPSGTLHKSLIVSEDGTVQVPESSDGEEDTSDRETSRRLEGFVASQRMAQSNERVEDNSDSANTNDSKPGPLPSRSSQKRRSESLAQEDNDSPTEIATSDSTLSSSSSQPPLKRPKPNSSGPRPRPIAPLSASQLSGAEIPPMSISQILVKSYQKHPTHWILDGNVIVRISNVQFKLIRSILTKHSRWFRDAFDEIDGRSTQEHYNGCPVYILDGIVRLKDFERLLDAMDAAITFVHDPPPFPILASIIRASTILDFTHFKRYSRRMLEDKWALPVTLRSFNVDEGNPKTKEKADENKNKDKDRSVELGQEADEEPGWDEDDDEEFDIDIRSLEYPIPYASSSVMLARECDIPSILPRAMYELVTAKEFGLKEVRTRNGGVDQDIEVIEVDEEQDEEDEEKEDENGKKYRPKLPEDVYRRLIRAREKLTKLWMTHIVVPPNVQHFDDNTDISDEDCKKNSRDPTCIAADRAADLEVYVDSVLSSDDGLIPLFVVWRDDPITGVREIMNLDWEGKGYCENCVRKRRVAWVNMIKSWWKTFEEIIRA